MPQTLTEPRRLYRQIADRLRELIRAGVFTLGARLPPERDLAVQFGVSRPSVREALIALEVEGMVEVRMGSGIYVLAREPAFSSRQVQTALGPFDIIRARQLIESELAARVARTRKAATLRGLREAIASMQADIAQSLLPIRGDRQFHVCLAEACDNSALLRVVTQLCDERHNPLFDRLGSHFESVRSWGLAVSEHLAVVAAIDDKDPARARAAMHLHLERTHDRFEAAWVAEGREPVVRRARERQPA